MSDKGAAMGMGAGIIAFANEFLANGQVNFRIAIATPLAGLFLHGIGEVSDPVATGLGVAMLITVMVVPVAQGSQTPIATLANLFSSKPVTATA